MKNITALIGENGTGKSTIIEYLSKFFIENESIDDLRSRKKRNKNIKNESMFRLFIIVVFKFC